MGPQSIHLVRIQDRLVGSFVSTSISILCFALCDHLLFFMFSHLLCIWIFCIFVWFDHIFESQVLLLYDCHACLLYFLHCCFFVFHVFTLWQFCEISVRLHLLLLIVDKGVCWSYVSTIMCITWISMFVLLHVLLLMHVLLPWVLVMFCVLITCVVQRVFGLHACRTDAVKVPA